MTERSYDYPAKNVVRGEWMRFLPDLSHPNDTGLYLPGPENLELPGYLGKGMIPARLIGAEHDPSRVPRVLKNAGGIRVVRGSVIDAVHFCEAGAAARLRFANLDFDGNQHTFTEELLALARVFPSLRGSSLAVTSYSARDREALAQGAVNTCKFYSGLSSVSVFTGAYGRMLHRYELLRRLIPGRRSSPQAYFQRELGFLWWVVLMLSVIEPLEEGILSIFDQRFIDRLEQVVRELTTEVTEQLSASSRMDEMVFVGNRGLRDVLSERPVYWWVNDFRRYAYYSSAHQPMRTWFFRIVPTAARQEETAQSLLSQVWELASRTPLIYIDPEGDRVTIERRQG